jgi:hypothetical protein
MSLSLESCFVHEHATSIRKMKPSKRTTEAYEHSDTRPTILPIPTR